MPLLLLGFFGSGLKLLVVPKLPGQRPF